MVNIIHKWSRLDVKSDKSRLSKVFHRELSIILSHVSVTSNDRCQNTALRPQLYVSVCNFTTRQSFKKLTMGFRFLKDGLDKKLMAKM